MPTVQLAPVHCKLLKAWTVLIHDTTAVNNTGNTTENILKTFALPAASMGPNGMLRIWTLWSFPNTANNKTMSVKLGGTAYQAVVAASTSFLSAQNVCIIKNRGAQNSQISAAINFAGIGIGTQTVTTGSVDTSAGQNVTITAQLAVGSENLQLEDYFIELYYGA